MINLGSIFWLQFNNEDKNTNSLKIPSIAKMGCQKWQQNPSQSIHQNKISLRCCFCLVIYYSPSLHRQLTYIPGNTTPAHSSITRHKYIIIVITLSLTPSIIILFAMHKTHWKTEACSCPTLTLLLQRPTRLLTVCARHTDVMVGLHQPCHSVESCPEASNRQRDR